MTKVNDIKFPQIPESEESFRYRKRLFYDMMNKRPVYVCHAVPKKDFKKVLAQRLGVQSVDRLSFNDRLERRRLNR